MNARNDPSTPPRDPPGRPSGPRQRSLVLVNTGDGKGKSTAAFGVVMRAVARDWRACVIPFIKSRKWKVGAEGGGRRPRGHWLKSGDGVPWGSPGLGESLGRPVPA